MRQTANTKLNQWEKTDRILMSDFNSDNQKLDAALLKLTKEDTAIRQAFAAQDTAIRQAYAKEDTSVRQSIASLQAQINDLTARTVPTLLKEYTTTKAMSPIVLNMSVFDWSVYKEIIIESWLVTEGAGNGAIFSMSERNYPIARVYARTSTEATSRYTITPNYLILSASGDRGHLLHAKVISGSKVDDLKSLSITPAEIDNLYVYNTNTSGTMGAGCVFKFYGVKI